MQGVRAVRPRTHSPAHTARHGRTHHGWCELAAPLLAGEPRLLPRTIPAFMGKTDKTLWGHGIVIGRAQILKSPRANRCWEARTEVFKTYDQWARGSSNAATV